MAKRYRATKNPDGTFNLHDLEVFGEMRKGERNLKHDIDKAWLENAVTTARLLEGEAFKYNCHVQHNGMGLPTKPSGYIRLTGVRQITYRGRAMDALHADIVSIPPDVFQDILDRKLPYRSVEVNNATGEPEVNTLALLSTLPPHFQFPVLDDETIWIDEGATVPATVAAFAALKSAQSIGGEHHKELKMAKKMTLAVDADGTLIGKTEGGAVFYAADGDEPRQREFLLRTPEGEFFATFQSSGDDALVALRDENDALKLRAEMAEAMLAATPPAVEVLPVTITGPSPDAIKLQARIDVLEDKDERREAADRAKTRADGALASLKGDGWHVPARCVESIKLYAASDDDKVLDTYVEEFKATRPKDPVRLRGAAISGAGPELPDSVLKFNADGPDAFEKAMKLSAQYDELAATGNARSLTREQFIESHMKPLAVRS